jgi:23S rRNA (cytidine1920-2'-O)/16S rRNA (cytidine1409-2'-O)-methyltransferase
MSKPIKIRLDQRVQELAPHLSRTQIASLIMQGKVLVAGEPATKAGALVSSETELLLNFELPKYVGRAGFKLEHALQEFDLDVTGCVVMDAGLSTGGFTDCLLQRGAVKVYGVDVGYGQVHEKIRQDPRVVVMERVNLRHLESLPELVDLVTLDLSFISVLKVLDAVVRVLKPNGKLVVLIKPQFEAGKHQVGTGGVITDPAVHQQVIDDVTAGIEAAGFVFQKIVPSPIKGGDGNQEFLASFVRANPA